jgi:spermidine/putrescine transport system substrate-binding protein
MQSILSYLLKHKTRLAIFSLYTVFLLFFLYLPKISSAIFPQEKALNIIVFPEMISSEILYNFTQKTGIKINAKNVETDAEVFIHMDDENASYDLALVSNYLVPQLVQKKKLAPLNDKELSNYKNLHKFFQKKQTFFYSIPYAWSIFAFGVNTQQLVLPENVSWNYLFQPLEQKICVPDEPLTLVSIAALGQKFNLQKIGPVEMTAIESALKEQKQYVEIYTDTNIALLFLNKIIRLAFASYKTVRMAHEYNPDIKFVVPKEGGIVISNDWVILEKSKKQTLAREFINFCLTQEIATINQENTEFLPTHTTLLQEYWSPDAQKSSCPLPPESILHSSNHAPSNLNPQDLAKLWAELKVHN